jgi:hypothetical protein
MAAALGRGYAAIRVNPQAPGASGFHRPSSGAEPNSAARMIRRKCKIVQERRDEYGLFIDDEPALPRVRHAGQEGSQTVIEK